MLEMVRQMKEVNLINGPIFPEAGETCIITEGARYLRIEGVMYVGALFYRKRRIYTP